METSAHRNLKELAAGWLRAMGCCAIATEVRCPISRYRVDAAGYADPPPAKPEPSGARSVASSVPVPPLGTTIFVECKAFRADFLRDTAERPRLLTLREKLMRELDHVAEEFVKPGEPELRDSGNFLFGEMESWQLDRARSPAYRAVIRELRRVDAALHGQTKFFMLAHYRLAEQLYLLAEPGIVEPTELPRGWGLLTPRSDPANPVRVVVPASRLESPPQRRLRALRNIAAAASRGSAGPFRDMSKLPKFTARDAEFSGPAQVLPISEM